MVAAPTTAAACRSEGSAPTWAASLAIPARLTTQGMRFAWYYALARALARRAEDLGEVPSYKPLRPQPTQRQLLADLAELMLADAKAVRDGLYPAMPDAADSPLEHVARIRAMFDDLPLALSRRHSEDATSACHVADADAEDLPDYFKQDFHFQTGGYLTEDSARLYDVQVETLFMGSAGPMRRSALRPIADYMHRRDQRRLSLLDVACGTGRFLRQLRLTYPALNLTGLDLSRPYLSEARRQLTGLRSATLLAANAEQIPLGDASQDIVTSIFLFHELPPDVRRTVTREMARVLKPGGLLVFIDSLQLGDKPGWDGLLEAFPVRFHEPYYRHYTIDDLEGLFATNGLLLRKIELPFLSRMMVLERI